MELTRELLIDPNKAKYPWVLNLHPADVKAGGGTPDIQFGACKVFIGDRPLVIDFQGDAIRSLMRRVQFEGESGAKGRVPTEEGNGAEGIVIDGTSDQVLLD